jgi:hypothetical protein
MRKKKVAFKQKGPKDDGSRWSIFNDETGRQVYAGEGMRKQDAERLCSNLVHSATIKMVVPPTEE